MTKDITEIIQYVSPKIRNQLSIISASIWQKAEEIHLSLGKPVMIYYNGGLEVVRDKGEILLCDRQMIEDTLLLLTDNSLYSANDKICNGYIMVRGGNRVGIVGTAVLKGGKISTIRDISSINIRLSREVKGTADKLKGILVADNIIQNTLIISPPKCGKTTLLRDISRLLGTGSKDIKSYKVSVIDERGEMAAIYQGIAENDVGVCTDVLDNCPKAIGIPFVVRSMSPDVIITDELGDREDYNAIRYALSCGVKVITSIHGDSLRDLLKKDDFKETFNLFDVFVTLTNTGGTGTIKEIVRRGEIDI